MHKTHVVFYSVEILKVLRLRDEKVDSGVFRVLYYLSEIDPF